MGERLHDEYRAALALRHTPGLGMRTGRRLLERYGSLEAAAAHAGSWTAHGVAKAEVAAAFQSRAWRQEADAEYAAARRMDARAVVLSDARYPERLREIIDPPLVLYVHGRISLLGAPAVAVVGSRQCTAAGLDLTWRIAAGLSAAGLTVISGLAAGIDRQAHLAGLEGVGSSIAVMATGIDRVYPESNRDLWEGLAQDGLLLSEHPPGCPPAAHHFPVRNRLISGLAMGVLVTEAAGRSGSLITARQAMEQGREVFACPGPAGQSSFEGCHDLLRQGAALVEGPEDILRELAPVLAGLLRRRPTPDTAPPLPPPVRVRIARDNPAPADSTSAAGTPSSAPPLPNDLTPEDRRLLEVLAGADKIHIDQLTRTLGWTGAEVSRRLLLLEMRGLVRQWPGMYYGP